MANKIVVIVIFIVFLGCAVWHAVYFENSADHFTEMTQEIYPQVSQGNSSSAEDKINVLYDQWEREKPVWSAFINHNEVDLIHSTLLNVRSSFNDGDEAELYMNLNLLEYYFHHIAELNDVIFENIF